MLRSLLVALDGSETSIDAMELAFTLALRFNATVEGLGIVNSEYIQRPEPVPLGAVNLKFALDLSKLKTARERIAEVVRHFESRAKETGVRSCNAIAEEGRPAALVGRMALRHDLIVVGRDSMFDEDGELYDLPMALDRIVRTEPRPVMIVPKQDVAARGSFAGETPLIAFDGSPASSRALHMFALLGFAEGRDCHVVTIGSVKGEAATTAAGHAGKVLQNHGARSVRSIGLDADKSGNPAQMITVTAKAIGADVLVLGAYGRRGIVEIFGSCTRSLLNSCPLPLFLHH